MNLSASERSQLIIYTAERLRHCRVSLGNMPVFRNPPPGSEAAVLELSSKTADEAARLCGDNGYTDFLRGWLARKLAMNAAPVKPTSLPLISGFGDILEIAKEATKSFSELPQSLIIVMRLHSALTANILLDSSKIQLANGLFIISGLELFNIVKNTTENKFLDQAIRGANDISSVNISKNSHYLMKYSSGFAGLFNNNPSARELMDTARSLYGLLIAEEVMENGSFETDDTEVVLSAYHNVKEAASPICYMEGADSDLVQFFSANECTLDYMFPSDPDSEVVGENESEDELVETQQSPEYTKIVNLHTEKCERLIARIVSAFGNNDHCRKIQVSALWLYRSYLNTRPLDAILESTIALEVLLGDREMADRIGLTKLLANRCAYLIGKTQSQRLQIIDDFQKVYRFRSEIVHSGLHTISREHRDLSSLARSLAEKVIRKEIDLI